MKLGVTIANESLQACEQDVRVPELRDARSLPAIERFVGAFELDGLRIALDDDDVDVLVLQRKSGREPADAGSDDEDFFAGTRTVFERHHERLRPDHCRPVPLSVINSAQSMYAPVGTVAPSGAHREPGSVRRRGRAARAELTRRSAARENAAEVARRRWSEHALARNGIRRARHRCFIFRVLLVARDAHWPLLAMAPLAYLAERKPSAVTVTEAGLVVVLRLDDERLSRDAHPVRAGGDQSEARAGGTSDRRAVECTAVLVPPVEAGLVDRRVFATAGRADVAGLLDERAIAVVGALLVVVLREL